MDVVLDRSAQVDHFAYFGEGVGENYIGQTFKALAWQLHEAEFQIATFKSSPGPSAFRLLVTTIEVNGQGQHPGTVLFESGTLFDVADDDYTFTKFVVDMGNLKRVPGQTYAFIIDFLSDADGTPNYASIGFSYGLAGTDYADGGFLQFAGGAGDRTTHFAGNWGESTSDLSFRLAFSSEGSTIVGTKKQDLIDGTHAPKNQSFATADDDRILGGKDKDKLFGLAGFDELRGEAGNDRLFGSDDGDVLIGGKGRDQLFGGTGKDFILFDAGLSQPADKLKDFNPLDDTIWLSQKVFKALPLGAISDDAFHGEC